LISTSTSSWGNSIWANNLSKQTILSLVRVDETLVQVLRLCLGPTYCQDIQINEGTDFDCAAENTFKSTFKASKKDVDIHGWIQNLDHVEDGSTEVSDDAWGLRGFKKKEVLHPATRIELAQPSIRQKPTPLGFREQQALHFSKHVVQESPPSKLKRSLDQVEDLENMMPYGEDHEEMETRLRGRPRKRFDF